MNIVEKILAKAAGTDRVSPGEIVEASIDKAMMNDITGPLAIDAFRKIRGVPGVQKTIHHTLSSNITHSGPVVWLVADAVLDLVELKVRDARSALDLHGSLDGHAGERVGNTRVSIGTGRCTRVCWLWSGRGRTEP